MASMAGLTHDDALRMHAEAPGRLARLAVEESEAFAFEPRDMRGDDGWGGEVRVCLNANIVLHFVPRFDEEMPSIDELPQFVVMPDDDNPDTCEIHRYEEVGDLEAFDGVVFRVEPRDYDRMVAELTDLASAFGAGRFLLPDTLYGDTRFVRFVTERVLPHDLAQRERPYDFTKRTF